MKIIKTIMTIIFLCTIIGCGSSSGTVTAQQRLLIVKITEPQDLGGVDKDELSYQAVLYQGTTLESGESAFGPAELASYNADEDLYYSRIDNILDGAYTLQIRLVSNDPALAVSTSLGLMNITQTITISGNETTVEANIDQWTAEAFDDDGDGVFNYDEIVFGTDPNNTDTDGDGISDSIDAFPINASESYDIDADGLPDGQDNDTDNDGLSNQAEKSAGTNPLNSDSDYDGVLDGKDNCPVAENASQTDTDGDGLGDACDPDKDGDGLTNSQEAQKGTNELKQDTDGDACLDGDDMFPNNAGECNDNDGDGIGDNADADDDNDGINDVIEIKQGTNPLLPDTDGDGVKDKVDNCPLLSNPGQANNDGDSMGDDCDLDDDNDGVADTEEEVIGDDGFITNRLLSDTDGDGFDDSKDNCATLYNVLQTDTDGDGFGDVCDCGPTDFKINQLSPDLPDPQAIDSNCDGIDGNRYKAVFVSTAGTA
ncbi:MAG: thrombospondin type 3 repeat-containing protein, partial [Deltaproteobacteria bacterium]|nr:thrombospondin type 3 repeat-containing protein [Deltaproteobacteria bacterium]